jgi:hypothetical protein
MVQKAPRAIPGPLSFVRGLDPSASCGVFLQGGSARKGGLEVHFIGRTLWFGVSSPPFLTEPPYMEAPQTRGSLRVRTPRAGGQPHRDLDQVAGGGRQPRGVGGGRARASCRSRMKPARGRRRMSPIRFFPRQADRTGGGRGRGGACNRRRRGPAPPRTAQCGGVLQEYITPCLASEDDTAKTARIQYPCYVFSTPATCSVPPLRAKYPCTEHVAVLQNGRTAKL